MARRRLEIVPREPTPRQKKRAHLRLVANARDQRIRDAITAHRNEDDGPPAA